MVQCFLLGLGPRIYVSKIFCPRRRGVVRAGIIVAVAFARLGTGAFGLVQTFASNLRGRPPSSFATLFTSGLLRVNEAGKFRQRAIFVFGAARRATRAFSAVLELGH
jgi:hypothetical protein